MPQHKMIISEKKLQKLQEFYKGNGEYINQLSETSGFDRSTLYKHLKNPKRLDIIKALADYRLKLQKKAEAERKAVEAKI